MTRYHTSLTSHHITQRKISWAGSQENHHTSHIAHISPHHSTKKFLGRKQGELSHITYLSHLTTSLSEEVLGPEARNTITHRTSHITHVSPHHSAKKFLGRKLIEFSNITRISQKKTHLRCRRAENYENYHVKPGKDQPRPKTTRITTKNEHLRS